MAAPANPALVVTVRLSPARANESVRACEVAPGTTVRSLLRSLHVAPEGSAVWWNGDPVPLDFVIVTSGEMEVVRTFSGG